MSLIFNMINMDYYQKGEKDQFISLSNVLEPLEFNEKDL
jgi:hypothetical protein